MARKFKHTIEKGKAFRHSPKTSRIFKDFYLSNRLQLLLKALSVWSLFTLAGWVAFPMELMPLFSHCVGLGFYLLIVTQKARWLIPVSLGGFLYLGIVYMAVPSTAWVMTTHILGYATLLSILIAHLCLKWVGTELNPQAERILDKIGCAFPSVDSIPSPEKMFESLKDLLTIENLMDGISNHVPNFRFGQAYLRGLREMNSGVEWLKVPYSDWFQTSTEPNTEPNFEATSTVRDFFCAALYSDWLTRTSGSEWTYNPLNSEWFRVILASEWFRVILASEWFQSHTKPDWVRMNPLNSDWFRTFALLREIRSGNCGKAKEKADVKGERGAVGVEEGEGEGDEVREGDEEADSEPKVLGALVARILASLAECHGGISGAFGTTSEYILAYILSLYPQRCIEFLQCIMNEENGDTENSIKLFDWILQTRNGNNDNDVYNDDYDDSYDVDNDEHNNDKSINKMNDSDDFHDAAYSVCCKKEEEGGGGGGRGGGGGEGREDNEIESILDHGGSINKKETNEGKINGNCEKKTINNKTSREKNKRNKEKKNFDTHEEDDTDIADVESIVLNMWTIFENAWQSIGLWKKGLRGNVSVNASVNVSEDRCRMCGNPLTFSLRKWVGDFCSQTSRPLDSDASAFDFDSDVSDDCFEECSDFSDDSYSSKWNMMDQLNSTVKHLESQLRNEREYIKEMERHLSSSLTENENLKQKIKQMNYILYSTSGAVYQERVNDSFYTWQSSDVSQNSETHQLSDTSHKSDPCQPSDVSENVTGIGHDADDMACDGDEIMMNDDSTSVLISQRVMRLKDDDDDADMASNDDKIMLHAHLHSINSNSIIEDKDGIYRIHESSSSISMDAVLNTVRITCNHDKDKDKKIADVELRMDDMSTKECNLIVRNESNVMGNENGWRAWKHADVALRNDDVEKGWAFSGWSCLSFAENTFSEMESEQNLPFSSFFPSSSLSSSSSTSTLTSPLASSLTSTSSLLPSQSSLISTLSSSLSSSSSSPLPSSLTASTSFSPYMSYSLPMLSSLQPSSSTYSYSSSPLLPSLSFPSSSFSSISTPPFISPFSSSKQHPNGFNRPSLFFSPESNP